MKNRSGARDDGGVDQHQIGVGKHQAHFADHMVGRVQSTTRPGQGEGRSGVAPINADTRCTVSSTNAVTARGTWRRLG